MASGIIIQHQLSHLPNRYKTENMLIATENSKFALFVLYDFKLC